MVRGIIGVAAGLGAWMVVATAGNLALRAAIPGYGEAEAALRAAGSGYPAQITTVFTLAMMVGRLLLGAASSVAAGATTAWIARGNARMSWVLGILLIALFIPVHVALWDKFPLWYHVAFLVSLLPCTLLGAALGARSRTLKSTSGAPPEMRLDESPD